MRLFNEWYVALLAGAVLSLASCADVADTDGEADAVRLTHIGLSAECDRLPESSAGSALLGLGTDSSIAGITGYHDCQSLVTVADSPGGAWSYGPVTKLWAVRALDSYNEQAFASAPMPGLAVAVVTMEESPEGYSELGIEAQEQCVYLRGGGNEWTATVAECTSQDEAPDGATAELSVIRDQSGGTSPADYPPVVRWGWDSVRNLPYIGVRCGAAWCDIGPKGFEPSPEGCEGRAKGYCDEQLLAVERNGRLVPARGMRAILEPVSGVDELSETDFREWTEVATVRVTGGGDTTYVRKFNYHPGLNRMFFRLVDEGPAAGWQAMIVSASARDTVYRHVVLDQHDDNVPLPGAARWAWSDRDESSWVPCPSGCCYVSDREILD